MHRDIKNLNILPGIPILMYHEVNNEREITSFSKRKHYPYVLDVDLFKSQMHFLKFNQYKTITIDCLVKNILSVSPPTPLLNSKIVLSFDDGYIGNFDKVYPILLENNLLGNFFVISSLIGSSHMMTWEHLREMVKYGMVIGSHTDSHCLIGSQKSEKIRYELEYSKKTIEDKIGQQISYISLPHGSYNDEYKDIAIELGYEGGATSDPGLNTATIDPFYLKRMNVSASATLENFGDLCRKNKSLYSKIIFKKKILRAIKRILGEQLYLRAYNKFFGVDKSINNGNCGA